MRKHPKVLPYVHDPFYVLHPQLALCSNTKFMQNHSPYLTSSGLLFPFYLGTTSIKLPPHHSTKRESPDKPQDAKPRARFSLLVFRDGGVAAFTHRG